MVSYTGHVEPLLLLPPVLDLPLQAWVQLPRGPYGLPFNGSGVGGALVLCTAVGRFKSCEPFLVTGVR